AIVTIDIFMNGEAKLESLLFVPFPYINKKGLVKPMEWSDQKQRGGTSTGSLTILFDEKDDSIFYKYSKDFEEIIEASANKIQDLRLHNAPNAEVQTELESFYASIIELLDKLAQQELGLKGPLEAFPEEGLTHGQEDYNYKIIVIGDPSVGKSSMILRYTEIAFTKSYIPTIGVNITEKYVRYHDCDVQLVFWDLAGQTKFQKIRHQFYQGAVGAVLVYDLTKQDTFKSIPDWYQDIKKSMKESENLQVILCGNKSDMQEQIQVSTEDGLALAKELNVDFFETSALNGDRVAEAFEKLIEQLIARSKSA
ncbi:MAG TPA: Rab family GTPase, partial [Candidatus Lokiarchaeia archaeon]|nr:Rab family GTPase [Candidatus Lokiarchaeia archaeon]